MSSFADLAETMRRFRELADKKAQESSAENLEETMRLFRESANWKDRNKIDYGPVGNAVVENVKQSLMNGSVFNVFTQNGMETYTPMAEYERQQAEAEAERMKKARDTFENSMK